jgi:general secretion pathway protein D
MVRRSVLHDVRRRTASPHTRCALAALALSFTLCVSRAPADPLVLQPATLAQSNGNSAIDPSAAPPLDTLPMSGLTPSPGASTQPAPSSLTPPDDGTSHLQKSSLTPPDDGTSHLKKSSLTSSAVGSNASTPTVTGDLAKALARTGDLTLRNSSLQDALFTISELWHINIAAGEVHGSVNGVFKDAPLREILDSILLSNGYGYRTVGDSLVISPLSDVGQVNPFFHTATVPVRSADIDEVVEAAKLLSTPQGQVRPMKSARSLMVLDYPDRVEMIRDLVSSVDNASRLNMGVSRSSVGQPLEVAYFRTQYIAARTASEALQAVISKEGRIGVLDKEDRLVITDYAENLSMVEQVLKKIDRPRPQVRITALIYDLSLQDIEDLGINWKSDAGSDSTSFSVDSVMKVPFDLTPDGGGPPKEAGSALTFMNLSPHFDLTAVVQALQTAKDARLLANPHVAVLENEEATFQSVEEIPYQQLTQTQQGGQIGTTAFKDAGVTLTVQPKISAAGTIEMKVKPEFSRLTGFTPGDNQPIIDRRTASTTLSIANRQTVVIGGLRQRDDIGDFNGIPYLKDTKVIGRLFRSRNTTVKERELVVFIMPEIIGPAEKPSCREQLVADTTRYRLDMIPQAEGCPPCYEGMYGPTETPSQIESQHDGQDSVLPTPADDVPAAKDAARTKADIRPLPESVKKPPVDDQAGISSNDPQFMALVAQGRLRRLPPVVSEPSVAAEPPADEASAASIASQPTSPYPAVMSPLVDKSALRPDYDHRYRATSDIGPVQQGTDPNGPQPEEKKGFWSRVFRF